MLVHCVNKYLWATLMLVPIMYTSSDFTTCNTHSNKKVLKVPFSDATETSFCVFTSANKLGEIVFINSEMFNTTIASTNTGVRITAGKLTHEYFVIFYIKRISTSSYRHYKLEIMDSDSNILTFEVEVRKPDIDFYIEPRYQLPGLQHNLFCQFNNGSSLSVNIYKSFQESPVNISLTNTAVYTFKPLQCRDMGTYTCAVRLSSGETIQRELDIKINICAPIICDGQSPYQSYQAYVGETVGINFCVISANLSKHININQQYFYLNQPHDENIQVISNTNQTDLYHNITVLVHHIVPGDDQLYEVMFSSLKKNYFIESNISNKTKLFKELNEAANKSLTVQFEIILLSDNVSLCDTKHIQNEIFLNEGDKLKLSMCINVSLRNELHQIYVNLNGTLFNHTQCLLNGRCVLWSRQYRNDTLYLIHVVIENITKLDFGPLYVTVGTRYNFSQTISEISCEYNLTRNSTKIIAHNETFPFQYKTDQDTTHTSINSDDNSGQLVLILTVAISFVILLILVTVILIKIKFTGKKRQTANRNHGEYIILFRNNRNETSIIQNTVEDEHNNNYTNWQTPKSPDSIANSGRHLSREGLVYITVDHSQSHSQQNQRRHAAIEPVVYAQLKF